MINTTTAEDTMEAPFSQFKRLLNSPRLSKGPLAWIIISLLTAAFLFPYFIPGNTYSSLGSYSAIAIIPLVAGAFLRLRKGSLIPWLIITLALTLKIFLDVGLSGSSSLMSSYIFGNVGGLILGLVAGQFCLMSRKLAAAHTAIQKLALTDGLTGLPNHRSVMEQLEKELNRARRFGRPLSIIFFDGDRFKRVNDSYGHVVGDLVLRQLGERAGSVLRGGDTLGRYGGEEFVALLPEANAVQAKTVAERIRAAVATIPVQAPHIAGGINITISVGIATYPQDGNTISELLDKADQAMYWAKQFGRNQVRTAAEAERASRRVPLTALFSLENREALNLDGLQPEQAQRSDNLGMIYSLMCLIELRDRGISDHSHAVSELATAIAQEMAFDQHTVIATANAALLHDIGKIGIPDALLNKSGPLSPAERIIIMQHPELGAQILEASPSLHDLIPAIRHHHERWDGTGYPDHLVGESIPLMARVIAVAEAYHAMITDRPYQASRTAEDALAELQRCAGAQFDPLVIQATSAVLARQIEATSMPRQSVPT